MFVIPCILDPGSLDVLCSECFAESRIFVRIYVYLGKVNLAALPARATDIP
jgi:hypothetical protein